MLKSFWTAATLYRGLRMAGNALRPMVTFMGAFLLGRVVYLWARKEIKPKVWIGKDTPVDGLGKENPGMARKCSVVRKRVSIIVKL